MWLVNDHVVPDAPASPPVAPTRNRGRMKVFVISALVIAVGFAAAALFADRSIAISGQIDVLEDSDDAADVREVGACTGSDVSAGYDDIRPGTGVTVRNESGDIIATGRLDEGSWTGYSCAFEFAIPDVPEADFYEFEISHRGEQRYSHADLEAQDFRVELSLGP